MEMERMALIAHIISGYLCFGLGALIMVRRKGDGPHRRIGRVYFMGMRMVCVSAVYLAYVHDIGFLFYVGLFVGYLAESGRMAIRPARTWVSALVGLVGLLTGYGMLRTWSPVLVVFASITFWFVGNDLYHLIRKTQGRPLPYSHRIAQHIGKMTGSYIGAVTAFLVVNVDQFAFSWVLWLGPTIVLTPIIALWTRRFTATPPQRTERS